MLIAAAAMAFTSCDKDQIAEDIQINGGKLLTITAGKPEVEDEEGTRTEMDEEKNPLWSVGDQIGVSIAGDNTQYAFDSKTDDGGKTATFTGKLTAEGETTVYAYYPYGADNTLNDAKVVLTLPAEQHPTAVSFDGAADILIAKPESVDMSDENPTISAMRFKRMTGVLSIVLVDSNNLLDGNIKEAKLTVAKPLAGNVELDLVNGTAELAGDNAATTITAVYDEPIDATALHFSVYPQMLEKGSELKLEVVTDTNLSFNRTINIPEDVDIPARKITTIRIAVDNVVYSLPFIDDLTWASDGLVGDSTTDLKATDYNRYAEFSKVYKSVNGLKLGSSSDIGSITTANIDLSKDFSVIVYAKLYNDKSSSLAVSVGGETQTATLKSEFDYYVFKFNAQNDPNQVVIATQNLSEKRCYIRRIDIIEGHEFTIPASLSVTSEAVMSFGGDGGNGTITYSVEHPVQGESVSASTDGVEWIKDFQIQGNESDDEIFGEVSFVVEPNPNDTEREATIKLSYPSAADKYVTIKQSAAGDEAKGNIFESDDIFVFENGTGTTAYSLGETTFNNEKATGFRLGSGSNTGKFTSGVVGISGDATLSIYAVGWNDKAGKIKVSVDNGGSVVDTDTYEVAGSAASGNGGFTITVTDSDKYTFMLTGLTEKSTITFESQNLTSGDRRVVVAGAHLTEGIVLRPSLDVSPAELTWLADDTNAQTVTVTFINPDNAELGVACDKDAFTVSELTTTTENTATFTVAPKVANEDVENELNATVTVTLGDLSKTVKLTQQKAIPEGQEAVTATFDSAAQGYDNGETVTNVKAGDISIAFAKATGSNDPAYYNTGSAVRVYGGNTITVSGGTIIGVTFTFSSGEGTNAITADSGSFSSPNWTGSANSVVFTIDGSSGHRRIQKIDVTYLSGTTSGGGNTGGGETTDPDPEPPVDPNPGEGTTSTITFNGGAGQENGITGTVESITWIANNNGGNDKPNETTAHLRLYAKNQLTFSGNNVTIKKIKFNFDSDSNGKYIKPLSANVGTYNTETYIWEGSSSSVVFTNNESAQARIISVEVTYIE